MKSWPRSTILLALPILVSCSRLERSRIVEALFDDPPRPARADTSLTVAAADAPVVATAAQKPIPPGTIRSRHAPYATRDCVACHSLSASRSFPRGTVSRDSTSRSRLPAPQPDANDQFTRLRYPAEVLCYRCHGQMSVEELSQENTVIHGAVTQGFCGTCHDPHESRYPKLVTRGDPPADLCYYCHTRESVGEVDRHGNWLASDCLECHDAHASRGRHLLLANHPPEPTDSEAVDHE